MRTATKLGEFTYADYISWPESERWELLDGRAHAKPRPNIAHQTVVFELSGQLANALLGKRCRAFAGPVGVRLPQNQESDHQIRTVFEPDLVVVCDPAKIGTRGIRGAPDWVIEVLSPSTSSFDQIEKRAAYEKAGVRELWLIDIPSGVVTRFVHTGAAFAATSYHRAEGELTSAALPELRLELDFMKALRAGPETEGFAD